MFQRHLVRCVFAIGLLVAGVVGRVAPAEAASCPSPIDVCVALSPSSGPVGTRVSFAGHVPASVSKSDLAIYRHNTLQSPTMGLERDVQEAGQFCEILGAAKDARVNVSPAGNVSGDFVVGGTGVCNHDGRPHSVTPGLYTFNLGCISCQVGYFRVTAARSSSTLPFTGTREQGQLATALGLIILGTVLTAVGSRRRRLVAPVE